jgi:tetratricopeptide (TPR) repeat protein
LYRGIAFAELGRKQEAIQEYLKGTELNPKFKSFYFRRWLLYGELNEPELAQKDYEAGKAILGEPDETPKRDPRDPLAQHDAEKKRRMLEQADAEIARTHPSS